MLLAFPVSVPTRERVTVHGRALGGGDAFFNVVISPYTPIAAVAHCRCYLPAQVPRVCALGDSNDAISRTATPANRRPETKGQTIEQTMRTGRTVLGTRGGIPTASAPHIVTAERQMRALATIGDDMATPEPATAQVVAMLADHKLRLRMHFMADGRICPQEQELLDTVREEILPRADEANLGRELMVALGTTGRVSSWQKRKVREFGRDHNCNVIDLDDVRAELYADDTA